MRFLWSLLLLSGLTLFSGLSADAGPIFGVREFIVNTFGEDDDPLRKNYSLITWENIEWFRVETKLKCYDDPKTQKYSQVQNEISFPRSAFWRNLDLEWQREEARKYQLDEWGADYRIQPVRNWIAGFSTDYDVRVPKNGLSFYRQNLREFYTKFHLKSFVYSLSYNQLEKEDETKEYTHQSNQLYQTLTWAAGSGWEFGLFYQEKVGSYPEAVSKNAQSQKWGVKGNCRGKGDSRLFWNYAATEAFHGYSIPGREQELQLGGLYQLTDISTVALTLAAKDHVSFQIDPELYDPDEIITDTQKSYRDFKTTLEYQIRGRRIAVKLKYWIEKKDFYQESENSGMTPGLSGLLALKWKACTMTARFSQTGIGAEQQSKYQLTLDFKI